MSKFPEVQAQLSRIINYFLFVNLNEETFKRFSCEECATHDTHDFIDIPVNFQLMLNDGNEAIGDDRRIDLYAHCILGLAPECLDAEMLFQAFEVYCGILQFWQKEKSTENQLFSVLCRVLPDTPVIRVGPLNPDAVYLTISML